jgi:protein TonB
MKTICVYLLLLVSVPLFAAGPPEDKGAVPSPAVSELQEKKGVPANMEDLDAPPTMVKSASPVYPESAKKDTLEGTVYLQVKIDKRGSVAEVRVEKGVREDLNNAAVDAMRKWIFKPPTKNGKPVEAMVVVPFRFKLSEKKQ